MSNKYLTYSPEVLKGIKENAPIVALESTIISHGMPYPQNRDTAIRVEGEVRKSGAIPATIAIMDGKLKIGMDKVDIDRIASRGRDCIKTSRRDIPVILNQSEAIGTTTVAATMILANMAKVRVFATGGIGGVHRGAEQSMDISADLQELSRTKVAVICAGAKSILDIGLTLEYLETHGVPVWSYRSKRFPAFFTRDSGFDANIRVDEVDKIAQMLDMKWSLGLEGGVVIGNPIPKDKEASYYLIEKATMRALEACKKEQVKGKEITPFLLSYIERATEGLSLKANIELVLNNARLASEIAKSLSKL